MQIHCLAVFVVDRVTGFAGFFGVFERRVCRDLDMDKSTVAKMLVRLEKDGLVTKSVHPDDVRAFQVRLTDRAVALVPRAREIQEEWLSRITNRLTDLEKRNFFELIEKVAAAANE